MEEMEEAFSNFKVILFMQSISILLVSRWYSLEQSDNILLRLTTTRRTSSRLPTPQSPFSSCGLFSTFSHRSAAISRKLKLALIYCRSPLCWCSTPLPILPTSWCGASLSLGQPGHMPSTGIHRSIFQIFDFQMQLDWNCNFPVGSSVGWVSKLRSSQERCGTIASSPSWARQVLFYFMNKILILRGLVLICAVSTKKICIIMINLQGVSHGFLIQMKYCKILKV